MPFTLSNEARGRTVSECHRLSWEIRFACENGHGGRIGADELPQRFPPETRPEDIAQRQPVGALDMWPPTAIADAAPALGPVETSAKG
jgi:hypothetical protein